LACGGGWLKSKIEAGKAEKLRLNASLVIASTKRQPAVREGVSNDFYLTRIVWVTFRRFHCAPFDFSNFIFGRFIDNATISCI
jgi:hypothetical protein